MTTQITRRILELQAAIHRRGDDVGHDAERCPLCRPGLTAQLTRSERVAPARDLAHQLPELAQALGVVSADSVRPGTIRPVLGALELPQVQAIEGKVTVMGIELGTDQARALWAQLGEVLGEAQRHRRPRAWADLQAWLDHAFRPGVAVPYRETATRSLGEGLAVMDGTRRALVRVGIFQVAHLKRRRSGGFSGAVADYFPGSMGTGPRCPDAMLAFTGRRLVVRGEALESAGQVA